ncbi:MAG TPA: DUF1648 domain-containing protein [Terriglobales bacterium]|nr:DUF1648 domain-containing protein [Terriglobales bacterium]
MNGSVIDSDSRRGYRLCAALLWLALPASALLYASSWHRLPARVATHFDFQGLPNGWASRDALMIFFLVLMFGIVATATWVLSRVRKPDPTAWALLALFYVVAGTLLWSENSVIRFNAAGVPVNVTPVLSTIIGTAIAVAIIALITRRGAELTPLAPVSEERHASAGWTGLFVLTALAMCLLAGIIPVAGARFAVGFGAILMIGAAAMAWAGFQYLFTPEGIEIRTLGFRLRSIPAAEIQSYSVDHWSVARGYGIRGVGDSRAYVWSNTGVRIKTTAGEVFLGHEAPGKIIHDLDVITKNAVANHKGHEGTQSVV